MPKRQRSGSTYLPVAKRPRAGWRPVVKAVGGKLVRRTLGAVSPYIGAAMSVAPYVRAGYRTYRGLRKRTGTKKKSKTVTRGRYAGRKGAAFSKSAGFFGGTSKDSVIAPYLNKGVVQQVEYGDVVSEPTRQVVLVGHSTAPRQRIFDCAIASILKLLFKKAGIKLKNWNEPILEGANIPARLEIKYKDYDGSTVSTQAFLVPVTKTLLTLLVDVATWFNSFSASTFPSQWLSMQYYHDIGTIGSTRLIAYDIDLTATTIDLYCRSNMKIQNRTINSTGNDQADDVDNVPLHGKHFTFKYNGSQFRDYNTPAVTSKPQLYTDASFGSMNYTSLPDSTGTTLYDSVPEKKQFIGCLSAGPAHLDPGEVKTSKLDSRHVLTFSKLMNLIKMKGDAGGAFKNGIPFYIGKTRFFAFEKMINAVAMSAENAFKLAFEIDLTVGVIATVYENHQTAKFMINANGQVA